MCSRLALAGLLACGAAWPAPAADVPSRSVEPGSDLPLRQFVQRAWTAEDGLPQSSVTALAETPDGYLWAGTFGGLARFDGERFQVFDPSSDPPLPSGRVLALAVDPQGVLWVGTESGALLRRDREGFTEVALELPRPRLIWSIAASASGGVWVATSVGVARVHSGRQRTYTQSAGIPAASVRTVVEAADGTVWIATERGLARLVGERFFPYGDPQPVAALARDASGVVAFAVNGRRLVAPDPQVPAPAADELAAIVPVAVLAATDGSLWLGGAGLARFAAGRLRLAPSEADLLPGPARALLEDREGSVWVGTDGGGMIRFRRGAVATFGRPEGLRADGIVAVLEDQQRVLWIGSCSGLWQQRLGVFREISPRGVRTFGCVRALEEDTHGDLWVGHALGATRFGASPVGARPELESLAIGGVRGLLEDGSGRLWAATDRGLAMREPGAPAFMSGLLPAGERSLPTGALLESADGSLWVGLEDGAADLGRTGWRRHGPAVGLPDLPLRDLYEERAGRIWAATYGAGLALFDGMGWRIFGPREGLPDTFLSRLLPDGRGALWVTGNRGLFRVALDDLAAVESGRRAAVAPLSVGDEDGLRSAEFNGGGSPAGWRGQDGRIWLPNLRGLAVLDPDRVVPLRNPVPTLIAGVRVDGRPARLDGAPIALEPGASELEIRFTAIAFTAASALRFRYQLEGFDTGWLDAGGQRRVVYRRLAPGAYRFRAAASRNEGPWGEEAVLDLEAQPFLYQRAAFRWGTGAVLLAAFAGAWGWRTSRLRAQRRELERQVAERTAELAAEKRRTEDQLVVLGKQERELAGLARSLERRVHEQTSRLRETRDVAILTLARIAELRDGATGKHLERIAAYSQRLAELLVAARGLGLDPEFVEQIFRSSPLHDIGKVAIPDAILRKPGPLTEAERKIMEAHTTVGGDTLRGIIERYEQQGFLAMGMGIAYSHHEHWSGKGYPSGLAGEEIPLAARIVAVVDAYDAITSERPYKPALSHDTALARIHRDSGTHFDPELALLFTAHAADFADLRLRHEPAD
jgi:response regulator RpfG family c-di-GMP phosphodiesterase